MRVGCNEVERMNGVFTYKHQPGGFDRNLHPPFLARGKLALLALAPNLDPCRRDWHC